MIKRFFSSFVILGVIILGSAIILPTQVTAASISSLSDTLSTVKASTAANHTILFASPTGVAAGQSIILTFTGFGSTSGILFSDVDFATGSTSTCSSATYTEQTLAGTPATTTWGVTSTATSITILSGTGTSAAGNCMRIKIGTNATNQTTGVNQISNGTAGTATIAFTGTFSDTGTLAVPIITNDVVTVSATINPTISFSVGSNSVALGTLTTGAAGTGSHTISSATNATGGFAITYNGPTLTSGTNTIPVYTAGASVPGTPGFGINLKANTTPSVGANPTTNAGTCGIATSYNTANTYAFVASTPTAITAVTAPADCVFTVSYIANIGSVTPAGSYSAPLVYTSTSTY